MIKAKPIYLYLRAMAFLVIAAVVFNAVSLVCTSANWSMVGFVPQFSYRTVVGMKDIPADSVDVAFFGASSVPFCISTMTLFGEYGIRAQNLGVHSQSMFSVYLMMQEFLQTHSVKIVFLEVTNFGWDYFLMDKSDFRFIADGLPLSFNKITAIKNIEKFADNVADSSLSYILPLTKSHNAWKYLHKHNLQPFVQADYPIYYYGSQLSNRRRRPSTAARSFRGWTDTGAQAKKALDIYCESFINIIQLCRDKNIPLILFAAPAESGKWGTPELHNTVQKVANEMGVPFIDFKMQNVFIGSGFDFAKDQYDINHSNRFGAEKISRYLGKYLRDNFDLPDRRDDPEYAYMHDDLVRYNREMFLLNFSLETNMSRYLDLPGSTDVNKYTIIFSVKDDCQAKMGADILKKLRALGFVSDKVFEKPRHSFIGVWQDGKVIYEARSGTIDNPAADALEYTSVLPDGMKFYVKSAGWLCGNVSNIVINGVEYSKNYRGFNVVVYDNFTGRVVDSIAWDTHHDAGLTFRR